MGDHQATSRGVGFAAKSRQAPRGLGLAFLLEVHACYYQSSTNFSLVFSVFRQKSAKESPMGLPRQMSSAYNMSWGRIVGSPCMEVSKGGGMGNSFV